ncbi:MAG: RNA polymerase-binding protein RbpA [Nocardioidaceae bacterium]|nr:RNA polymerase-binding protein RbpA [Nocardioidaceae bacterium]
MSERATLRGSRLGGTSFEDESGIEFAPRQRVVYDCVNGHDFEIPMAVEAEVPFTWECPRCGALSQQRDGNEPESKLEKPARTHWDMLLERRSIPELEDILSERLELLRAGEIGPPHLHRRSSSRSKTKKSA